MSAMQKRLAEPRAVLFDLDDTLYDSTRLAGIARRAAVEAMVEAGLGVPRELVHQALLEIVAEFGSNDSRHFDRLLTKFGQERDTRVIAAGIVAYHNAKHAFLRPFVDTVPTLLSLRDHGCLLGVVSNGVAVKQWEKLIRLGLQHVFHGVVVSEEVGAAKPDVVPFDALCELLSVSPEACWFVGNHPDCDMRGARDAGMQTVFIRHGRFADTKFSDESRPDAEIEAVVEVLGLFEESGRA